MASPRSSRRGFLRALCLPLVPTLAGCGGSITIGDPDPEPRFTHEGLSGKIVGRLRPGPAGLLAATDDSAYRRSALGWTPLNLGGQAVQDIAAVSQLRILASIRTDNGPGLLRESLDAGATWHDVQHDFGGPGTPELIRALHYDAAANRLVATGANALAVSTNFGRHWTLLAGQYHAFASGRDAVAVDPFSGDLWFGGQDAIESLVLDRRRATTGAIDAWRELMPSPSVAKAIRFAGGEPGRVLVAGEGGIVQTRDNGASWRMLLSNGHRFHFDVLQDPNRPSRLVTASWEKNFDTPQPLIVNVSDHGATWRTIQHPDARLFGGPWSMAVQLDALQRTVFLFGLYRGGVVRLEL